MGEMKRLFAKWSDNSPASLLLMVGYVSLWSAICFKRAVSFHVYLQSFLHCGVFSPLCVHFLLKRPFHINITKQTRIHLRTKRAIYVRQKQTCIYIYVCMSVCMYVGSFIADRRIRGIELYSRQGTYFMYHAAEN